MQTHLRKLLLISAIAIAILLLASLSACSAQTGQPGASASLKMAPMSGMPAAVQSAAVSVQQAYQFSVANPDVVKHIPCYCGCGNMGHTSNYSCYVASVDNQGTITFDNHALGCSICVDITHDAMRMTKDGKSPGEIRAAVDVTYSKYGPSNMP